MHHASDFDVSNCVYLVSDETVQILNLRNALCSRPVNWVIRIVSSSEKETVICSVSSLPVSVGQYDSTKVAGMVTARRNEITEGHKVHSHRIVQRPGETLSWAINNWDKNRFRTIPGTGYRQEYTCSSRNTLGGEMYYFYFIFLITFSPNCCNRA